MSGIFSIFNLDGANVSVRGMEAMGAPLRRRGPDRMQIQVDGAMGIGHTLLATTPELRHEAQPVLHSSTGCIISADVRLDNRDELLAQLGLFDRRKSIGDAGLILEAYLTWGQSCPARFLGDFAFVIWDPRRQLIFCARDQFGVKPLYIYHHPGKKFAVASEPKSILCAEGIPRRINEGRIADFLVPCLEWIDFTSTFYEGIERLPPAQSCSVSTTHYKQKCYWTLEPKPYLKLNSDEAYAEALLEVLTESVRCRLRGVDPAGILLSGGLDSGSVAALAGEILQYRNSGPLHTFSAISPHPQTCSETRSILSTIQHIPGLTPHLVDFLTVLETLPDLEESCWDADEPFDWMSISRAAYSMASLAGVRVVLNGAAADIVLSHGTYVLRLFHSGQWIQAFHENNSLERSYGCSNPWTKSLRLCLSEATPDFLRRSRKPDLLERILSAYQDQLLLISPIFANRVNLRKRFQALLVTDPISWCPDFQLEQARKIHGCYVAGAERYNRVASSYGVEPRDPFIDRRFVEFCLSIPWDKRASGGFSKLPLRNAMIGRLPYDLCWRMSTQHLGWDFATSIFPRRGRKQWLDSSNLWNRLRDYVNLPLVERHLNYYYNESRAKSPYAYTSFRVAMLFAWLENADKS